MHAKHEIGDQQSGQVSKIASAKEARRRARPERCCIGGKFRGVIVAACELILITAPPLKVCRCNLQAIICIKDKRARKTTRTIYLREAWATIHCPVEPLTQALVGFISLPCELSAALSVCVNLVWKGTHSKHSVCSSSLSLWRNCALVFA